MTRYALVATMALAALPAAQAERVADVRAEAEGPVSWYGRALAGRRTASGERYDPLAMTLAHRELPFGTWVRVTNLRNRRSVVLRVNDRGPMHRGRIGDVSMAAARMLGLLHVGSAPARLEVLRPVDRPSSDASTVEAESLDAAPPP